MSLTPRATGVALAFVAAIVSGVAVYVNAHGVSRFDDATVYTTAKNVVAGVLLLALALPVLRGDGAFRGAATTTRTQWVGVAAIAVIGGSVPFVLFFEGLSRAEATQAAFIQKTLVVWVALLAVPILARAARAAALRSRSCSSSPARRGSRASRYGRFGAGEAMILAATLLWAVEVIVVKSCSPTSMPGASVRHGWRSGRSSCSAGSRSPAAADELAQRRRRPVELGPVDRLILAGYVATWFAALARAQAVDVTAVLVFGAVVTALLSRRSRTASPSTSAASVLITAGAILIAIPATQTRLAGAGMTAGPLLFARYAYPPNALGYCGADEPRTLLEYGDAGPPTAASPSSHARSRAPGRTSS